MKNLKKVLLGLFVFFATISCSDNIDTMGDNFFFVVESTIKPAEGWIGSFYTIEFKIIQIGGKRNYEMDFTNIQRPDLEVDVVTYEGEQFYGGTPIDVSLNENNSFTVFFHATGEEGKKGVVEFTLKSKGIDESTEKIAINLDQL